MLCGDSKEIMLKAYQKRQYQFGVPVFRGFSRYVNKLSLDNVVMKSCDRVC